MPLIWSWRFISGYVGFLGDKGCVCGGFCFREHMYIQRHLEVTDIEEAEDIRWILRNTL